MENGKTTEIVLMSLKEAREQAEMTQKEAAEKLGVSLRTLGRWENNGCNNIKFLFAAAKLYGVAPYSIIAKKIYVIDDKPIVRDGAGEQ